MFGKKLRSAELVEKRRRRIKRLAVFFVSGVFILILLASLVPRLDAFSIKEVGVTGNSIESSDSLIEFVRNEIKGNYLFIFPKSTWLFYPDKSTEEKLLVNFQRLEEVDLSYEGNNSLLISVKERKPDWIWCRESECFFLDEAGLIFAKAPNFTGPVFFKAEGAVDVEAGDSPIGKTFNPPWSLGEMKNFINSLRDMDFIPVSLSILEEDDTNVVLKDGTVIKLSPKKSLVVAASDLQDAVNSELLKVGEAMEYIDLRFENKIYYKAKEEN